MNVKDLASEVVGMIPEEGKILMLTREEFQQVVSISWICGMIDVTILSVTNPSFLADSMTLIATGTDIEEQMIELGNLMNNFIYRENASKA